MGYEIELNRFRSFENYPETEVSFLRMSQSGFYYPGEGSVVRCYSCGLEVREWRDGETVAELHRRLAPHCPFLNGNDVTNTPLLAQKDDDINYVLGRPTNAHDVSDASTRRDNDADRGLERQLSNVHISNLRIDSTENNRQSELRIDSIASITEQTSPPVSPHQSIDCDRERNSNVSHWRDDDECSTSQSISHSADRSASPEHHTDGPDINGAKYPQYASRTVRSFSLATFPRSDVVSTYDLSEAGLFYTGINYVDIFITLLLTFFKECNRYHFAILYQISNFKYFKLKLLLLPLFQFIHRS